MTLPEWQQLLQECASVALEYLGKFLNSGFTIAFIGALAGAFAGATGAQRIIERSKGREELLKELRNTNAAIMVSFTICNTVLGVKKQIVKPLYEQFRQDRAAYQAFLAQSRTGQNQSPKRFHFNADLQSFAAPILPTETLNHLVFDGISAYGRSLGLVSMIENAAAGLATAVAKRDRLIAAFGQLSAFGQLRPPPDVMASHYFGEQTPSGDTPREHADVVEVIHSYTNDLIFFSSQLCADLIQHGQNKRRQFEKQFGKGAPEITKVDFGGPKNSGLFPPDSDYSSWSGWITEGTPVASN